MPTHTMNSGSIASGGIGLSISTTGSTTLRTTREVAGGQPEGERRERAGSEADDDALERRPHVHPELAVDGELEHLAEDQPGPREKDRVEQLQEDDETGRQAPERQKPEHRARAQGKAAPTGERSAAETPLHQLGQAAQEHATATPCPMLWTLRYHGARAASRRKGFAA